MAGAGDNLFAEMFKPNCQYCSDAYDVRIQNATKKNPGILADFSETARNVYKKFLHVY